MIDPSELVENLVATLRDIPDLVTQMGGEKDRISAYHDQYPKNVSLAHAIHQMPVPGIMAVWQGTAPGTFGGVDVWKHQITLYLRAQQAAGTYYRLFRLITKGVPLSSGVEMLNTQVHPFLPSDGPAAHSAADGCRGARLF